MRHKRIDTDTKTKGGLPHVKYRIRTLRRLLAAVDKAQRAAARTGRTPRQICPYAAGISAETPPDTVQPVIAVRAVVPHLREVDEAARSRFETIADREQAHEIICAELVYD